MSTSIRVSDDLANEYTALRMKRAHRYLIFKVTDDKEEIVVEHIGARDATFEEFKENMPKDQPR